MSSPSMRFIIHDMSCFPVVRQRRDAVCAGYAAQWQAEMAALIDPAAPFVVIIEEGAPEEGHEDRKQRGLWLKRNKTALAATCRAVIGIERDAVKRAALQAQSALAAQAFGVAMKIVATDTEAEALARAILG